MLPSRYVLARTTTALTCTSMRLAPSSRKSRRTRRRSGDAGTNQTDAAADSTPDVDEVERLLAATTTRPSGSTAIAPTHTSTTSAASPDQRKRVTLSHASLAAEPTSLSPALDPSSALHFNAVHHATAVSAAATTVRGGPTHAQQEQIERRRSKPSLSEAEFDVGVTERLLPELPRLPALHEVHYGDASVHELDRSLYFAKRERDGGQPGKHTDAQASTPSLPSSLTAGKEQQEQSTVVIGGEACVELSLDGDLSEGDFSAFDTEAATMAPTTSAAAQEPLAVNSASAPTSTKAPHTSSEKETATERHPLEEVEADADAVAVPLSFGTSRPWFVPASGVVELETLTPEDCALLLRFVLYLRQQTVDDLVPTLRRALQQTETRMRTRTTPKPSGEEVDLDDDGQRGRHALTLADIIRYLDTAPPPVIGFTESLPTAAAAPPSLAGSTAPSPPSPSVPAVFSNAAAPSPAFVFHLYLENVSSQNAVGHLATLFGLPQRCFQTHSAVSKMSCTTVLCAVAESRLRREHLLLLNTLRHPGFVLRVSSIQEVQADRYPMQSPAGASVSASEQLFGELARWQPLYQTELLLRRVCSDKASGNGGGSTRQQLEHRLRAVQTLGAVCFCANREASLARAATDVLHGFFKSALLNALQRKKAPMPLQRFLKRPNVATAQHAHHVSTDATVRQVLKTFVQTSGNWQETVMRTPYVWRRRWINALRGLVWNTMASQRLRKAGRDVCVGDVVLKPEYRHDVHRRGIVTVKAEHVMVVRTSAEAAAASLEDVFLPFLRGRYPEHLFADEATQHPIMTRTNMLALLRAMHAPQLLLGLTDDVRLLLDVRAESSPLLFRRLIVRPVEMEFAILEDKPPMRALHYDAARLLTNDRWGAAATPAQPKRQQQHSNNKNSPSASPPGATPLSGPCHLIPPSEVLERTTLGSRLTSGVLAEDFFSVPSPDDYVVLGHAHRYLSGGLVPAAPHSDTADVGDRVYTVYVRAVVEYNLSGLSNLLREYFLLSGIETESDSALQHKVHRMRRELDPETPLLTAPVYCTTCFNRDHDTQEQCAEYQFKVHRRAAQKDMAAALVVPPALVADGRPTTPALLDESRPGEKSCLSLKGVGAEANADGTSDKRESGEVAVIDSAASCTVRMRWHLRRRNDEQRWGVHLTKALSLVGMENVELIREGAVWNVNKERNSNGVGEEGEETGSKGRATLEAMALPDARQSSPWPSTWINEAAHSSDETIGGGGGGAENASPPHPSQALLRFLMALFVRETTNERDSTAAAAVLPSESLHDLLLQSPLLLLPPDPSALQLSTKKKNAEGKAVASGPEVLKTCLWTLKLVNATAVATQRDVAAALLQHTAKSRDVWLTFETHVDAAPELPRSSSSNALSNALLHSTHAAGHIPQSTAALPPKRRHEVEAAMRAEVQRMSAATQRWLQDLPYRLTLVLVKHRRHLHKRRSWGLQLDGTDMTLVNFARLMVQYMYTTSATDKRLLADHAYVASLVPGESFPRNDKVITARIFDEVLPALEPLLNDMYRVVRINNTAVHHKAEAARAMAAFQVTLDEKAAAATAEAPVPEQFLLTLALERKGSSYRMCTTAVTAAAAAGTDSASTTMSATATSSSTQSNAARHRNQQQEQEEDGSSARVTELTGVSSMQTELLDGLATPQCPVRPLTPVQLTRASVTLAINRLLLTEQTRNKWGLRLQHGTQRLKAVQQNRHFSFHVFAAKQSQGTRIADTLRLVSTRRPSSPPSPSTGTAVDGMDMAAERGQIGTVAPSSLLPTSAAARAAASNAEAHVITRSFYLYYVERVNQKVVRGHAELRQALLEAAQPPVAPLPSSPTAAAVVPALSVASLPPESVTLTVRQLPLLRFAATVRRGGEGEGSALGPVGLQVDKNMCILSVFANSPMARALTDAVGPLCSARRLIQERRSNSTTTPTDSAESSAWNAVVLPNLRTLMTNVETCVLRRSPLTTSSVADADASSKQQQRQWAYDLDEDETAVQQQTPLIAAAGRHTKESSNEVSEERRALLDLADATARTFQQLGRCSMVDGVHVLQTSLLREYALSRLAALDDGHDVDDGRAGLVALQAELDAVTDQVRWEVVYAAQSNRPLRTPADLAAAFAPGVAEETVSIQQFVED